MERMLGAELTAHLGNDEGKNAPPGQGNRRNGSSTKVLKGQDGEMHVAVPRDSGFRPELASALQDATGVQAHPNAIGKFLRKLG